jgi:hypothetical protein
MEEYMIVPVEDINKLERARKNLHILLDSLKIHYNLTTPITDPMWKLTHRIYERILK